MRPRKQARRRRVFRLFGSDGGAEVGSSRSLALSAVAHGLWGINVRRAELSPGAVQLRRVWSRRLIGPKTRDVSRARRLQGAVLRREQNFEAP